MVGNRVASYASTVKRMADLGCETNSHTWAHTYLTNMSEGQILQSLNQTRDAIVAAGGNAPKGVRPPGGKINDASKAVLAKAGMPSIVWSVDTSGLEDEKCPEDDRYRFKPGQRRGYRFDA